MMNLIGMSRPARRALQVLFLFASGFIVPACSDNDSKGSGGTSGGTPPVTPPPGTSVPAAPQNVRATAGNTLVTLNWDAVAGATGYTIRSATDQGGPYGLVEAGFLGTEFIDDTLDNGTTYYWVITAINSAGKSAPSAEVSATPTGSAPPPTQSWNRSVVNPVLTASNNPGAWDQGGVLDPSIVQLSPSSWVMYYSGFPSGVGPVFQIGRATSSDGGTWTRTGATPVLAAGTAGAWDDGGVSRPHVLFDGTYRMWYTGTSVSVGGSQIGYATSLDGIIWTKSAGPVLSPGPSGSWDESGVLSPRVILDGGMYKMWHAGISGTGGSALQQVGYATSSDGVTWTRNSGPVLTPTAGAFDSGSVSDLMVVRDGTGYQGWYTGAESATGTPQIGFATSSDGIAWVKQLAGTVPQPVLDPGASGSWDAAGVQRPYVLQEGSLLRMWYTGRSATFAIGLATSGS